MERGDIDNRLPPRWLVVFEGVIGITPTVAQRQRYEFYIRTHAWKRAINHLQLDAHSAKVLWDLTWRQGCKFDVVTFLPGDKTKRWVQEWLDEYGLPVSNVLKYSSPQGLAQNLAYMPDVWAVVHSDSGNRFAYGDRGVLVSDGWTI